MYIVPLGHPRQNGISDTNVFAASQGSHINKHKNTKGKFFYVKVKLILINNIKKNVK